MELERFPITIPVAAAYLYCFLSLSILQIQAIAGGFTLLTQEITYLLLLLVGGISILFTVSIAFTHGVTMLKPKSWITRWDTRQSLIVTGGLAATAVWQLFLNQLTLPQFTASLAPQSAFAFKTDAAIAEESFFGAVAIMLYTLLRVRFKFGRFNSIILASLPTAILFMEWHNTDLAYASMPQALVFVLGLRMIIAPITLYTHSLFSGIAIHWPWNAVS